MENQKESRQKTSYRHMCDSRMFLYNLLYRYGKLDAICEHATGVPFSVSISYIGMESADDFNFAHDVAYQSLI